VDTVNGPSAVALERDPPMIACERLHHRLGGGTVLAGFDLAVEAGECLALVGANGAGKSTLLKALLDIGGLDAGTIRIDGIDHADRRARRRLAYLPERFQPPHYLRGREFLHYMLALYGRRPAEAPLEATCTRLGLPLEALARPVQGYSKGMAQMLGLAACLLSGRPLLVLDEPMSGLDPLARVRLRDALREHHGNGGTILFTTHLLADIDQLADRVAILHAGRIVASDTPTALRERFGGLDLEDVFVRAVGGEEAGRKPGARLTP